MKTARGPSGSSKGPKRNPKKDIVLPGTGPHYAPQEYPKRKYQPFEPSTELEWERSEGVVPARLTTNIDVAFKPLYTSNKRYFIVVGGRGSTKTYSVHDYIARLTYEKGQGILFTRWTMTSAEKSIIPEFVQTLERLNIKQDFHIKRTSIINKKTGSFIMFAGIKVGQTSNTANLKSLPNITTWVVEEGEDFVDERIFERIDDSLRNKIVQNRVIWVMNPPTREHFIYTKFFEHFGGHREIDGQQVEISTHPDVECIHTTYHNGIKYLNDSWLKKALSWRRKSLDGIDPLTGRELTDAEWKFAKKYYHNNYLGAFMEKREGVIFEVWKYGEFEDTAGQVAYGQDFGFVSDPNTLVKICVDQKRKICYWKLEYYIQTLGTSRMIDLCNQLTDGGLVVSDNAEPRLIAEQQIGGVNCVPAIGETILAGLMDMIEYAHIVSPCSPEIGVEFNNYIWADKRQKVAVDEFNHCIDAGRYAFRYITLGGQSEYTTTSSKRETEKR